MQMKRIIPCLDMDNGVVVKGVQFKHLIPCGDPVELAIEYEKQGADELCFLDIGATHKKRNILESVIRQVSEQVFIPLTVGGGIRSVQDIRQILRAGADKISVCTAALENPQLISQAADIFGSQCIVLSIDAIRSNGGWHATKGGGRIDTGRDAIKWAVEAEMLGAGEILLNSIDNDGTGKGYDIELCQEMSASVTIPVIASGGGGSLQDFHDAIEQGGCDAILTASLLHRNKLTIQQIKSFLKSRGVPVR